MKIFRNCPYLSRTDIFRVKAGRIGRYAKGQHLAELYRLATGVFTCYLPIFVPLPKKLSHERRFDDTKGEQGQQKRKTPNFQMPEMTMLESNQLLLSGTDMPPHTYDQPHACTFSLGSARKCTFTSFSQRPCPTEPIYRQSSATIGSHTTHVSQYTDASQGKDLHLTWYDDLILVRIAITLIPPTLRVYLFRHLRMAVHPKIIETQSPNHVGFSAPHR